MLRVGTVPFWLLHPSEGARKIRIHLGTVGNRLSSVAHPLFSRSSFQSKAMLAEIFQSPDWHKAATLTERLASLRGMGGSGAAGLNGDRAQSRWQLWRSQPPFTEAMILERRLAA